MHRADLINTLHKKIKKEGVNIVFGSNAKPQKSDDKVRININNESNQIEKDLIVVADGVNSSWKRVLLKLLAVRPKFGWSQFIKIINYLSSMTLMHLFQKV